MNVKLPHKHGGAKRRRHTFDPLLTEVIPRFLVFKRKFFSRVLKVPIDIVKSELTLWPGIIKWDLCDELNKFGLSSNLLIHLFQRLTELMK